MIRKLLTFTLATWLISLGCVTSISAQTAKEAQRLAKVKHAVNKIGIDEDARVSLQDGTILKGRIAEIGGDYFVLVEKKTANSNRISFAQVKQVKSVVDNPLGDPAVVLGLALIPTILGLAVLAKGH
ncbi:MAG TPA: hypothetical protein VEM96_19775 [Pyrinomonadaceae bacterium]|nr:hypothetical protein [Pyrinomonadaceae bacterium]